MKVLVVEKRCLNVKELASYLGVSKSLIYREYPRWCIDYEVKVYRLRIGTGKRSKLLFEKLDIDQKLLPAFLINPKD
jgi:hypothetical protein